VSAGRLRRLAEPQLGAAIARMEAASAAHLDGDHGAFDRWLAAEGNAPARLEFPLGELLNERIRGFAWAWATDGAVQTDAIATGDRFDAQGLEGKAVVEVSLVTALLVARDLPKHRVAVYTDADDAAGSGEPR
jgi:hypothetical protein